MGMDSRKILFGGSQKMMPPAGIVDKFLIKEGIAEKNEAIPDKTKQEPEQLSLDPAISELFKGVPGIFSQKKPDDLAVIR
jgi:hypothetical protein